MIGPSGKEIAIVDFEPGKGIDGVVGGMGTPDAIFDERKRLFITYLFDQGRPVYLLGCGDVGGGEPRLRRRLLGASVADAMKRAEAAKAHRFARHMVPGAHSIDETV